MHRPSYNDPLDGPAPKWVKHAPSPPQDIADYWPHIKRNAQRTTTLTSPPKSPSIDISAITINERFIADQIMKFAAKEKLISACSDPSGEQFGALSALLIARLRNNIGSEIIDTEHILFLLRNELKITVL